LTDSVIEIDRLTKTYRTGIRRTAVHAVSNLSLTVERGSVVAFIGPNGAGKTTTIHTLLGFLKPDSGSVRLFGEACGLASRRRLGFQSEIFHSYGFYKATEVLRFYGRMSGMSKDHLDAAIPAVLTRLGIQDASNRRSGTFSKGMGQRLGLAQALLHEPELLILDEPTSGLDPEGRRLVLEIIREEKAKGRTVFLSSHILSDVERTCDKVVMIRGGEAVFSENLSSFTAGDQQWEIEVAGWTSGIQQELGEFVFDVVSQSDGAALLRCSAGVKKGLLHRLTALPVDIGTVQRGRGFTLEEMYMKHMGKN